VLCRLFLTACHDWLSGESAIAFWTTAVLARWSEREGTRSRSLSIICPLLLDLEALRRSIAWTWALSIRRGASGRPVVLVFYPADWEPVSTDQLRRYNDVLPEVRALGADLVGVSVFSVWPPSVRG
jgi:hypothetical protein